MILGVKSPIFQSPRLPCEAEKEINIFLLSILSPNFKSRDFIHSLKGRFKTCMIIFIIVLFHMAFAFYVFFLAIFSIFCFLDSVVAFMICKVNILVFYSNCDFLKVFCSLNTFLN